MFPGKITEEPIRIVPIKHLRQHPVNTGLMTNARNFFSFQNLRAWEIEEQRELIPFAWWLARRGKNGVRGMWTELEIRGQRRERARGSASRGVPVPD